MSRLHIDAPAASELYSGLITAASAVLASAPPVLRDQPSRLTLAATAGAAKAYSKERSPRALAAARILRCIDQHNRLAASRDALLSSRAKFDEDRNQAEEALQRCSNSVSKAEAVWRRGVADHSAADQRAEERAASLMAARQQAAARKDDALKALQDLARAGASDAALEKAGAQLEAATRDAALAEEALRLGPKAEVLAVLRNQAAAAKSALDALSSSKALAASDMEAAREALAQVDIDRAAAEALSELGASCIALGRVGAAAEGLVPVMTLPGADAARVPLLDDGLGDFLALLVAPDYTSLDVDLSQLSDGNEPMPHARDAYFDEAATAQANRNVQYEPELPDIAGSRRPSVTYSDPNTDPQSAVRVVAS